MLIEKLVSLILSIPVFDRFQISDDALEGIQTLSSYLYQINSFLNLDLLFDTLLLALGLLLINIIGSIIRAVL